MDAARRAAPRDPEATRARATQRRCPCSRHRMAGVAGTKGLAAAEEKPVAAAAAWHCEKQLGWGWGSLFLPFWRRGTMSPPSSFFTVVPGQRAHRHRRRCIRPFSISFFFFFLLFFFSHACVCVEFVLAHGAGGGTSGAQSRRRHRTKRAGRKNFVPAPPATRPFVIAGHLRRRGSTPLFSRALKDSDRNRLSSFLLLFSPSTPILVPRALAPPPALPTAIENNNERPDAQETAEARKSARPLWLHKHPALGRPATRKRQRRAAGDPR